MTRKQFCNLIMLHENREKFNGNNEIAFFVYQWLHTHISFNNNDTPTKPKIASNFAVTIKNWIKQVEHMPHTSHLDFAFFFLTLQYVNA